MWSLRRVVAVVFGLMPSLAAAQWTAELSRDATAVIRYDGSRVLNFSYAAWGPNWKFADFKPTLGRPTGTVYPLKADISALNVAVNGTAEWRDGKLIFEWKFRTDKASSGNIGAAVSILSRVQSDLFNAKTIDQPALAGDKRGVTWTPVAGQTIAIEFEGLARDAAFEKGNVREVRAWVTPGNLEAGESTVRMTITLPPGATFNGVPASRYAELDAKTWLPNTLDWNVSPVDLSYLNDKPAGSRGFVKADGERLVYGDGTEAKFWGCNIQAFALFNATNGAIEQQAKRIAALGYNLVRLHHHDSADWVTDNVFVNGAPDTQQLNAKQLDRIDYWVKCLKDQGVYVWLDLHTNRPFRPGDDIPNYDELQKTTRSPNRTAKGFTYVNPRLTQLMKDFAKAYLTRTNPYTKTAYVDEPAVMGILITNENDITDHFGVNFLPDKNVPKHKALFDALRKPLVKAFGLDATAAAQTWLPGPSKVVLNNIQYDWSKDFIDYLHGLGVKVPIATTNTWGNDPLFCLPALAAGDVIDVHSYGQAEGLGSNPRHDANSALWIAAAQVAGKPVTVTEWNTPSPTRDRFTQPLYIAALAAFQGWDAPMIFGYQQSPLTLPTKLAEWGSSNDPAITPLMPAAALLYRRGDVSPAKEVFTLSLSPEALMNAKVTPETSRAIRTITERHGLRIGLPVTPWTKWIDAPPTGGTVVTDADFDALPAGATATESDTGELKRTWADGTFTIDTPRTQAAVGWIGGKTIALRDVTIAITTPKAAVVVSSMDGQPIGTSKKMLLTVTAQAGEKKTFGILAEPVVGDVVFKSGIFSTIALSPNGKTQTPMDADGGTGGTSLRLSGKDATHWFVLTRQ